MSGGVARGGVDAQLRREIETRLARVRERIEAAAARCGRAPGDITLVGVSKRQPPERIVAALGAGLVEIGESYVQELRAKKPLVEALLRETPEATKPRWRLVGRLQRNKASHAVALVDAVDSVDSAALARELDRRAEPHGRTLEVCLQVNLSGEAQKGGVSANALPELLEACHELRHLHVVGLMTVPAAARDPEASRPDFARLRALRDSLLERASGASLRELSMGMSNDFEVAIEEGATCVRVGSALFGAREGQR